MEAGVLVRPLEGLLVVALEQAVAAPLCTARLADAGARVIKIERPEGDFARYYDRLAGGESVYFVWLNRGKESVVLDLKRPESVDALMRIIDRADVFIENLAPGASERLGLGSDRLRARNARLVTLSIAGFAPGAAQDRKMYDLLVQAETGLAEVTGAASEPGRVGVSISDLACGLNAYVAILEALHLRNRTGEGSSIGVSLFDATAEWMAVPLLQHEGGRTPRRIGVGHPSIAPYGAFPTADGRRIVISIQNEREWQSLCAIVLAQPDLPQDPRFSDNSARVANRTLTDGMVRRRFESLASPDLVRLLDRANIAYGFLNTLAEFSAHPELRRVTVQTPGGAVRVPAPAARFVGRTFEAGSVPALGADTERVLREFGT